jgi:hypothetical protein
MGRKPQQRGERPETLAELPTWFRERAAELAVYAPVAAHAFIEAAEAADLVLRRYNEEPLTPAQAEAEHLCDAETLRRAVREGRAENVGTPGAIRVPRAQVPRGRKAGTAAQRLAARHRQVALPGEKAAA